ncbi:hypothetical protein REPUB_Repub03eG0122600 [Reevesia pubescens]
MGLIGRIFYRKFINMEAMRNVLFQIWKLLHGLHITEIGDKLYRFQLDDEKEKDQIFIAQPWFFDKALLLLVEIDDRVRSEAMIMEWCPFWIQIHGLPFGLLSEKIGIVLEDSIGDVIEIDSKNSHQFQGKYLRVRVHLNGTKPLK